MAEYKVPNQLYQLAGHLSNLHKPEDKELAIAKSTELANALQAHNIPDSLWRGMHGNLKSSNDGHFMFGQEMWHRLNAHEQEMRGGPRNPYHGG